MTQSDYVAWGCYTFLGCILIPFFRSAARYAYWEARWQVRKRKLAKPMPKPSSRPQGCPCAFCRWAQTSASSMAGRDEGAAMLVSQPWNWN